jgi:hypothetical protein
MCSIGEARDLSGFSDRYSIHELITCPLQAKPENVRAYRNSDRLCKDVHET